MKAAKLLRAIVILAVAVALGLAIAKLAPGLVQAVMRMHGAE